tara:strand:+ start:105 stop:1220 length:1116 start_codon:yes stop_codon:yes gene_type:complete
MLRQLARSYDRKLIQKSLDRQDRIAHKYIEFAHNTSVAFAVDETANQYSPEFDLTSLTINEGEEFYSPLTPPEILEITETSVIFQSDITTPDNKNNTFECIVTGSGSKEHAIVVFHHLYARNRYPKFAKFFASKGITVIEATLPYHFNRGDDGATEENLLSADIGRTVQAMRQAVLDGRKVVAWLHELGFAKISVVGMCIGGTVAGLVAAHEEKVDKAVLMVTPMSPADLVWTAETMKPLRKRIEANMTLEELRAVWKIINLNLNTFGLTRPELETMIILGEEDTIVRPAGSEWIIKFLQETECSPEVLRLGCGHSSIGIFPYNVVAAWKVLRFLKEWPTWQDLWAARFLIGGIDFTEGPRKHRFFDHWRS